MIIDMRCRYTGGSEAEYFVDRMKRVNKLKNINAFNTSSTESTDAFFKEISDAGVTTAVSVSGCNPGAQLGRFNLPDRTTSNEELADVQQRYPGKFLAVAGIDASNKFHNALEEIERCVTVHGMKAVTIEPGRAPQCNLNDKLLYPLYQLCNDLDVSIIPQTSGGLGGKFVDYANPHYIEQVAEDFPHLRIICGHGCYPFVREAIVIASRRDNIWLSPDGYFFHMGHEDWVRALKHNMMGFADRFLFASAYPLTAIKPFVENFLAVGWTEDLLEKIMYKNALTALNLNSDPTFKNAYNLD